MRSSDTFSKQFTFTIVIPVRNGANTLAQVLICLAGQTLPTASYEVIIVDDGSTDASAAVVERTVSPFALQLLRNPVNQGRALARNRGWQEATGEWVVFLDADVLPAPHWLQTIQDALLANPMLDVLSGGRYSLRSAEGQMQGGTSAAISWESLHESAMRGGYCSSLFAEFEEHLEVVCERHPNSRLCGYSFVTANVAVRRAALESSGGFDAELRRGEDTDLGIRLWEAGYRFGFAPRAYAYHLYDPRQQDRPISTEEMIQFFLRHPYDVVLAMYVYFGWRILRPRRQPPLPCLQSLEALAQAETESGLPVAPLYDLFAELYRRSLPSAHHHDIRTAANDR